ncbi:MAG: DUF4915 domain-containing protein [Anaerolineae bacterium]|nr:DUF4915 domain-containing protein [Anaerolineae bacterium]
MSTSEPTPEPDPKTNPLRSVYTSNLPDILARLNISLVVSTYQAGKVVLVRNDGGTINTHFRTFKKPMGMAVHQNRLTIGGAKNVWYTLTAFWFCENTSSPNR